ncbi:type IV secretory system conjugative DNA transfer family protein [Agrobacterium leguminum]|uniref:type IV secretory system conjugative DNA transfer family protein n=1 Tax=Agrobacterium leguminum TaxID=2792015 RepID=UPI0022B84D47|nr:type IV secretory system conjugative DNA transfer family protein [Agrobacterium leguminum]MCZ7935740.1 type IV secretory system conjugative DNA transfer family protein [Agrobacterium leguminum]
MDLVLFLFKSTRWTLSFLLKACWWILRLLFRTAYKRRRKGGSHGSSRWATRWEQLRHGAITGEGIILGRGAFRQLLRFSSDGMVMVFASMGSGKGLGVVIPSLLAYRGSMVVTDPKGENYDITRRRRAVFGKVRMLNPTDLERSDRYNPMDIIRAGTPNEADDAAALASLMIKPDAREAHWDDKASSMLKALILHTLYEPLTSRTLAAVRRLSVGTPQAFLATLEDITLNSPSLAAREIAAGALTSAVEPGGGFSPEFKSILSNLQKATEPWSAGSPAGVLSSSSTFDLAELTTDISTLFLCVDEDVLTVYERWLRVMVGCALKTLTRSKTAPPERKVVLLLDEVAVLGRLDPLERQSGLLRAYCTPVLIWQNLPQIYEVYGRGAEAFLANASARVFFGVNDNQTATYVANMLGNMTTLSRSSGVSRSGDMWDSGNRQKGQSESGYWLLDAAEVQRLPLTRTIVKLRNVPYSILGRRLDYRKIWCWRTRWDRWRGASPPRSRG